ncbi:MAG TPA: VOC family protein [Vicinamibacterales bacterium]|nr:VOC family protein [Vicinamibacterales bacterium]
MTENVPAFGMAPPGFRLPAETRLGRVRLQVADLSRSLDYYTGVLGLRVLSRESGGAALGAHGANQAPLVEIVEQPGARPVPRRGLLGLYHFALLLPDRPALGRFVQHLGRLGVRAGSSDHAVSESLYLTDPDGLGIEVYADRPRHTWQINTSELYMTVEPLDLDDLVRHAAGVPWTGTPAGTVMGHVHLHVGALDAAAAFYHSAIGFDKTAWSFPGALFLSAGGYHHHLGTNIWAAGAPPATNADARLLEWELVLPDDDSVDRTARSVAAAGFQIAADDADRITSDPWGTALRLRTAGAA